MGALIGKEGWQQSGNIRVRNSSDRVTLQANFKKAGYYTVQFSITPNFSPLAEGIDVAAIAEITWSVEGQTIRREVAVYSGATISGPGQGIKVVVRDNSPTAVFPALDYTVSIQVTPGTRANIQQPPILPGTNTGVVLVGPGASASIDIPQGAGIVSVMNPVAIPPGPVAIPLTTFTALIRIFSNAVILASYHPLQTLGFVPIPPGAITVTLANLSLDPLLFLEWQPLFGVDG